MFGGDLMWSLVILVIVFVVVYLIIDWVVEILVEVFYNGELGEGVQLLVWVHFRDVVDLYIRFYDGCCVFVEKLF